MKRFFHLVLLLILSPLSLAAEDFRVQVLDVLSADAAQPDGGRVNLSYAEGIAITLPADRTFLAGVEIELRIPAAVQARRDSFLEYLFRSVRPLPTRSAVAYSGERIHWQVVPSRVAHVLQIPLGSDSGLKESPYATVLAPVDPAAFPLVFRLMPAFKGLPEELEKAVFQVRVKPLLRDEGRLRLSWTFGPGVQEDAALSFSIDDKPVTDPRSPLILKTGPHSLRVTGPDIREEFRSFSIEQARDLTVSLALQDVTPRIILEYPERSSVSLDGKPLPRDARDSREGILVEPGEHVIGFLVGDYSIERKISVQRGRTYRVSLLIDLQIEEE